MRRENILRNRAESKQVSSRERGSDKHQEDFYRGKYANATGTVPTPDPTMYYYKPDDTEVDWTK